MLRSFHISLGPLYALLGECLFRSFAHFLLGLFAFLVLSHTFDKGLIYKMYKELILNISFEFLTEFIHSPPKFLITSVLNPMSGRLLASISFSSISGDFSCCFIWDMFLCFSILDASVSILDLLLLPVLEGWPYVVSVQWGSVSPSP